MLENPNITANLSGVFAALPTPVGSDGAPDPGALGRIVDFLVEAGVAGLCVGGATGEYAACNIQERVRLFRRVVEFTAGRVPLIFGIGGETSNQVVHLAAAADCGGIAALFPPPSYFHYDSEDLMEFTRQVGVELPLPTLLYNIPQFTNTLEPRRLIGLVESVPKIIGIKDSSGCRENLPLLGEAKKRTSMVFFAGSDDLFLDALKHGADGAISGVASACPELLLGIYKAFRAAQIEKAAALRSLLDEFIEHISVFPTPWGIKLAMQARGYPTGPLGWPAGARLKSCITGFEQWFTPWISLCLRACSSEGPERKRG